MIIKKMLAQISVNLKRCLMFLGNIFGSFHKIVYFFHIFFVVANDINKSFRNVFQSFVDFVKSLDYIPKKCFGLVDGKIEFLVGKFIWKKIGYFQQMNIFAS